LALRCHTARNLSGGITNQQEHGFMILSDLYTQYDGAIPTTEHEIALHGDIELWRKHVARAAERQFQYLILQALRHMASWRLHTPGLLSRRFLTLYSLNVQNYRQKACEAHLLT
jgi:hypothetical protein